MTRINLLPWREERRQRQQRQFNILLLATATATIIGVIIAYWGIGQLLDHQEERNRYLRNEIAQLQEAANQLKEIDRARDLLSERLMTLQHLQASRSDLIRILDTIPRHLPEDVFLTSFESVNQQVILKGIADSPSAISSFMRNLADLNWFGQPSLTVIETKQIDDRRANAFEIIANRIHSEPVPTQKGGQ